MVSVLKFRIQFQTRLIIGLYLEYVAARAMRYSVRSVHSSSHFCCETMKLVRTRYYNRFLTFNKRTVYLKYWSQSGNSDMIKIKTPVINQEMLERVFRHGESISSLWYKERDRERERNIENREIEREITR